MRFSIRRFPSAAAATALACATLAGCGTADSFAPRAAAPDVRASDGESHAAPDQLLPAAYEAATQARAADYRMRITTRKGRSPAEDAGTATGRIDLPSGAGTMTVTIPFDTLMAPPGDAKAESAELAGLSKPIELEWDRRSLVVRVAGGEPYRIARGRDDASVGLLGRFPDEPAGLLELLPAAADARTIRPHASDPANTAAHVRAAVRVDEFDRHRVPAQAPEAVASGQLGAALRIDVWVDRGNRPLRMSYTMGSAISPDRTTTVTYDYSWGRAVG